MRKLLLLALMASPAVASAQWTGGTVFPDSATSRKFISNHGISVDPEGKVWIQNYHPIPGDSVFSTELGRNIRSTAVYCFYPDGTKCPWSPIKELTFPDGTTRQIGAEVITNATGARVPDWMSGRGMRANMDGNILAVQAFNAYLIDYRTGQGIRWVGLNQAPYNLGSSISPGFDMQGNMYISQVAAGKPIVVLNPDFTFRENVTAATPDFSRTMLTSTTGDTVYWASFTSKFTLRYKRPDPFQGYTTPDTLLRGMKTESMNWNHATGQLWVSTGGVGQVPDAPYRGGVWYAFDPRNMDVRYPAKLDSIVWDQTADILPRSIAFDKAGTTAYVGNFNSSAGWGVRRYTKLTGNAVDGYGRWVPDDVLLTVGPNPSRGALNVRYRGLANSAVRIELFDAAGRRVATLVDGVQPDGEQTTSFDTSNLSAGTYYVRFTGGNASVTRPVSVLH